MYGQETFYIGNQLMMGFSKRVDYGLAAVAYLASVNAPVNARKVSDFYQFPQRLTANVLKELTSKGVLMSARGVHGGYFLSQPPEKISVYDVILALEGPLNIADCTLGKHCQVSGICSASSVMQYIQKSVTQLMQSISIQEVAYSYKSQTSYFLSNHFPKFSESL